MSGLCRYTLILNDDSRRTTQAWGRVSESDSGGVCEIIPVFFRCWVSALLSCVVATTCAFPGQKGGA